MDSDNGVVHNNQPHLGMQFESFHYASHFFVIIFLHWYMFLCAPFYSLQLVWTIVCRLCDIVYSFEKEKTMLAV
jgi:hypothetical protein